MLTNKDICWKQFLFNQNQVLVQNNITANTIFTIASMSKTNNSNFKHEVISCRLICVNCHRPQHFNHSYRQKRVDNHWFNKGQASPQFKRRQLDNWRQKQAS